MLTFKKFLLTIVALIIVSAIAHGQILLVNFNTYIPDYTSTTPVEFYFGGTTPVLAAEGWMVHIVVDGGDGTISPPSIEPGTLGDPTVDDFLPMNNNIYYFTVNAALMGMSPGNFYSSDYLSCQPALPEPAANQGDMVYLRVFSDAPGALSTDDWYIDSEDFYTIPSGGGVVESFWNSWPGPDFQLPVEMLSFEAVPGDGKATLTWVTASEIDNKEFHLYRDGVYVATVPTQAQGGSSTTELTYTYVDFGLNNGQEYSYTLKVVDINGNIASLLMEASVTPMVGATGITVTAYDLRQNYPNPFNPVTTIEYDVLETGNVHLNVYNISGQKVATLLNGMQQNGGMRYSVEFDAQDLPSGIYFYTVKVNNFSDTKKLVLLR